VKKAGAENSMTKNRIDRAELLVFKYVEEMYIQLRCLVDPCIGEALNMPAHGLARDEIVVLLYRMFEDHLLVAYREDRDLWRATIINRV
jgi:hypothetical protein